jgi:hypothetical protein
LIAASAGAENVGTAGGEIDDCFSRGGEEEGEEGFGGEVGAFDVYFVVAPVFIYIAISYLFEFA